MSPTEYTGKEIEAQPALVGELVDDNGEPVAPEHGLMRREDPLRRRTEWHCICGLPLGELPDELAISADTGTIQLMGLAIAGIYTAHIQEVEAQAR